MGVGQRDLLTYVVIQELKVINDINGLANGYTALDLHYWPVTVKSGGGAS